MTSGALPRPKPAAAPMRLARLAEAIGAHLRGPDGPVGGITAASAQVRPGDLFVAIGGARTHGIDFLPAARTGGAVAVLTDQRTAGRVTAELPGLAVLAVADVRSVVGPAAAAVYGDPSAHVRVCGVTGTSGKTTTTFLTRAGLVAAGRSVGLIGTVGTFVGAVEVSTGFTTPEAAELQALIAVMADSGCTDVLMEVSSHGLALGRVAGVRFAVAGFTNLSQDHLDFHPTMEDYFAAKATLFDGWARRARIVTDDEWGARLAGRADVEDLETAAITGARADWRAEEITVRADGGTDFVAVGPRDRVAAGSRIPGRYNVANALLAIALADAAGVAPDIAAPAIAITQVPGRMERVECGQPFLTIVDYAHKPAAVTAALQTIRALTARRVITVLGCGGDRDRAKRPLMGRVAAEGSDLLIVTDDNPRSEDPAAIRAQMRAGIGGGAEVLEIGDRAAAIVAAVGAARRGDTVLVAGKGHEPGQEIGGVVHPFDDRSALAAALGAAQSAGSRSIGALG